MVASSQILSCKPSETRLAPALNTTRRSLQAFCRTIEPIRISIRTDLVVSHQTTYLGTYLVDRYPYSSCEKETSTQLKYVIAKSEIYADSNRSSWWHIYMLDSQKATPSCTLSVITSQKIFMIHITRPSVTFLCSSQDALPSTGVYTIYHPRRYPNLPLSSSIPVSLSIVLRHICSVNSPCLFLWRTQRFSNFQVIFSAVVELAAQPATTLSISWRFLSRCAIRLEEHLLAVVSWHSACLLKIIGRVSPI